MTSLTVSILAVVGLVAGAIPAAASHDVTPARVAGDTRVDTAADIAVLQYDTAAEVLLATQASFPDALAAAPLAGERSAPILLTAEDQVPARTLEVLQELGTETVTIVGGSAAVSVEVEDDLRDRGYTVERIAGETRFATAARIARALQDARDNAANFPGGQRATFLANGYRFPDALTAGAPAARGPARIPIVLTEEDSIPAATTDFLEEYSIETVLIVGGGAAVSEGVAQQLRDQGYAVERIAGATRTDTATAVADFAQEFLGFDASEPALARGDAFPDALAAGPYQAAKGSPILLSATPSVLTQFTADWLAEACGAVDVIRAIGGEAAITMQTLNEAEQAAENCHDGTAPADDRDQDYIVSPQEPLTREAGGSATFDTGARYDDQPVASNLDIVLFPCGSADVTGSGNDTFTDADGDGEADGFASTDTGAAQVVAVNGNDVPQDRKHLDEVPVGDDGVLSATVESPSADCAIVVFFEDPDGDDALSVDADGNPVEPYGVGKVTFTS